MPLPPPTQGIKYPASKQRLLGPILDLVGRTGGQTVFDAFSGSTRVSQALARTGYRVVANDLSPCAKVLATCYLTAPHDPAHYRELIAHLNALPGEDGWFTAHYGGHANDGCAVQSDGLKRPFQRHNTRRLDAIRAEIDRLALPEAETSVLLTSLLLALDRVDNTLGHFAAYLRRWSARSYKEMRLEVPALFASRDDHEVWQCDALACAPRVSADVAYLDPPYGSNNDKMPPSRVRYAAYYHLWTTVCRNDRPALFGKARRRADSSDVLAASVFEAFRKDEAGRFVAVNALDDLLAKLTAPHVILSYSSGGRATAEALREVLHRHGRIAAVWQLPHRRHVMSQMRWTDAWVRDDEAPHTEYLFWLTR